MPHIVLLGDSVFDNAAYVRPGEPDVVRQLRARLPAGAKATLAAVDGATAADVRRQLERLPADATHLIVSAGGNDALGNIGVLDEAADSIAVALTRLAVTGLVLFNDVITRAAFAHGLPVLDLRLICDEDADFANPIEPSAQGGDKIAAAIARLVAEHDFGRRRSEVFVC